MTAPASNADLSALHAALARDLMERIKGHEEREDILNADGEVTGTKVKIVRASAAELAVARALLKDNAITSPPGASVELDDLAKALAERAARRASPSVIELAGLKRAGV